MKCPGVAADSDDRSICEDNAVVPKELESELMSNVTVDDATVGPDAARSAVRL